MSISLSLRGEAFLRHSVWQKYVKSNFTVGDGYVYNKFHNTNLYD